MRTNSSTNRQANNSSLKETQTHLLSNLLTLFAFTEELVLNIGYIKQTQYSGKIKNEKYKKAFADFYNRLPTLELFTADLDSEIIKEYLKLSEMYHLKNPVLCAK